MSTKFKIIAGILLGLILSFTCIGVFSIYNNTLGATNYIEIDKADSNLNISNEFNLSDKNIDEKDKEDLFVSEESNGLEVTKNIEDKEKSKESKEAEENKKDSAPPPGPSKYELKLNELKSTEAFILEKRDDLFHVALLGLDSREAKNTSSRTDAIIILTLDKKNKEIRLTSIPRDILILRSGKLDKITHAYLYGGGENTLKVLNNNFALDVREFAAVNMFDLEKILASFAPLNIVVSEAEKEELNYRIKEFAGIKIGSDEWFLDYSNEEFLEVSSDLLKSAGEVSLNANQLLAYLRIRKTDSAYARTDRHKEVISKILNKVDNLGLLQLLKISKEVFPKVTTSLDEFQIQGLIQDNISILSNLNIKSKTFPEATNLNSIYLNNIYYTDIKDRSQAVKNINNFMQGN